MKGRLYKVLGAGVLAGIIFFPVLTFAPVDTFGEKKGLGKDRQGMHYLPETIAIKPEKDNESYFVDDTIISGSTLEMSEDD